MRAVEVTVKAMGRSRRKKKINPVCAVRGLILMEIVAEGEAIP
jgi:hypothetical protein